MQKVLYTTHSVAYFTSPATESFLRLATLDAVSPPAAAAFDVLGVQQQPAYELWPPSAPTAHIGQGARTKRENKAEQAAVFKLQAYWVRRRSCLLLYTAHSPLVVLATAAVVS
jgi:hypothetical protein